MFQAVGGFSEGSENESDHANRSATLALDLIDAAESALKDPTTRDQYHKNFLIQWSILSILFTVVIYDYVNIFLVKLSS